MIALFVLTGCNIESSETARGDVASRSTQDSDKKAKNNKPGETLSSPDGAEATAPGPEASGTAESAASADGDAGDIAESRVGGARAVAEKSDLYDFKYAYPAEVGKIPTLGAKLDSEIEKRRTALKTEALKARADADENGFPYNAYAANVSWDAVSDLPGWLSLSKLEWIYSGGAHGNSVFGSMLWDKTKDRMVAPVTMFKSPRALATAVREPFCAALDHQRAKKRGAPADRDSTDIFDECINPVESGALVPASSNRRTFDRLTFLIPPYAAGPYSEGSYEVTLPVTQAVLDAVRPEYSAAFNKGR